VRPGRCWPDALGSGHHGVHQGQHLSARQCVTGAIAQVDQFVGQGQHLELLGQGGDQGQARPSHRPVVIEGHCKARRIVRFCVHRKDAFLFVGDVCFSESHLPKTGGIFRVWSDLGG
jgi:hypothetical protein